MLFPIVSESGHVSAEGVGLTGWVSLRFLGSDIHTDQLDLRIASKFVLNHAYAWLCEAPQVSSNDDVWDLRMAMGRTPPEASGLVAARRLSDRCRAAIGGRRRDGRGLVGAGADSICRHFRHSTKPNDQRSFMASGVHKG